MTKKLTFCSLMAVLGILCLVLSNVLQANTIFLYLFSTLFTYICTEEYGLKYGLLTYAVISLASFMIVADKLSITAYVIIAGCYPIVKHIIEHINTSKPIKWILKIAYIISVASIAFAVVKKFLSFNFNPTIIFAMGILIFVLYDIALTMGIKFYVLRLRRFK